MVEAWIKVCNYELATLEGNFSQSIWTNLYVLAQVKPVYDKRLLSKGIAFVHDLLDDKCRLSSGETAKQKFNYPRETS